MARFANTIDNQPIYAARAETDKNGDRIDTTYAKLTDIPTVPVQDVEVDGTSVVNAQGVAEITMPTVDQTYDGSSTNAQSGTAVAGAIATVNQVPTSTSADQDKVLTVDSLGIPSWAIVPQSPTELFEATYGVTSFADVMAAIVAKKIVYCNVKSGANQYRKAFLAYMNSSKVEFQYYRSISTHDATDQGDEVYIYAVSSSGWTTNTRLSNIRYMAGTNMTQSYSPATETLTFSATVPTKTSDLTNDSGYITSADIPVTDVEVDGVSVVSGGVASITMPSVPVTDVTVNGSSVVSSGTAAVVVPTATSDLQNDSGFITLSDVPAQQQADWTESDSSDPSYIAHKPNLAAVATSGSYLDLSNKPTINNVPAVTSSDDDKVLKASYTGGVGSYSWEDAESGGSYIAGDGIVIDQSNIVSVRIKNDYDNALKFTQSQGGGDYAYLQTPEGTPSSEGWQALSDNGYITYSYDDISDETSFEFTYLWDSNGDNPLSMWNMYAMENLHYDAKIHLLYISSKEGYTNLVATSNTVSDAFSLAHYANNNIPVYSLGSVVDTTGDVYKLQVNFTVPGDVGGIFNALAVSSSGTNYFGTMGTVQSSFLNETHVLAMQGSEVFLVNGEPVPGGDLYVQVDQTYDPVSAFPQSGFAVNEALGYVRQVPYSDSSDEGKVLKVDANGDPEWATGGGGSTYTAGNGIDITSDVISVDTSVVATQTDLSGKQDTLTAGSNISISNNVISATDTTYSAGEGIDITNNEISVDPESLSAQQLASLKRALGVDETVLWNSTPGSTTGNLSDAITNFERIRVYWHYHENGSSVQSPCIMEIPVDSSYTRYFFNVSFGVTNCYMLSIRLDFSNSFSTFTVQSASGVYVSAWGGGGTVAAIPSTTIANCIKGIYKIVGVGRIASN